MRRLSRAAPSGPVVASSSASRSAETSTLHGTTIGTNALSRRGPLICGSVASRWSSFTICRVRARATKNSSAAMRRKGAAGSPGTIARSSTNAEATLSALGWPKSCPASSSPSGVSGSSLATRVTRTPAAVERTRAGICETRPSPIVSRPYRFSASTTGMPFCPTPIASPARILMTVMMSDAMTSPFTNFIAPSIEP